MEQTWNDVFCVKIRNNFVLKNKSNNNIQDSLLHAG